MSKGRKTGGGEDLGELETILGYSFGERELLVRALTHSSFANERTEEGLRDNERLEFLGDAVLGLVISDLLFEAIADDEGALTRAKSHLVSARFIGSLSQRLGLSRFIRLGRGEEKDGGRGKNSILANVFEAVLGAVYLDGGMDAARDFLRRAYGDSLAEVDGEGLLRQDYKSFLQEMIQGRELPAPRYALLGSSGPEHLKEFTVEVRADLSGLGRDEEETKKERAKWIALCDENKDKVIDALDGARWNWARGNDRNKDGKVTPDEADIGPAPGAAGVATLQMVKGDLVMLRSGYVFKFDPKTLELEATERILPPEPEPEEEDEPKKDEKKEAGEGARTPEKKEPKPAEEPAVF